MVDIEPVIQFLPCRTPAAWVACALGNLDTLLVDHASLELKAAQQAQQLIWKYGASERSAVLPESFRHRLMHKMSRLAREELRHFEQVEALLERRGQVFTAVSASRYAAGLHALVQSEEPGALVDVLVVGAIIEARSCERFASLVPELRSLDPELAEFYASLLRAEARHFEDYLALARELAGDELDARVALFLARDAELVESADEELRFHSGVPGVAQRSNSATTGV